MERIAVIGVGITPFRPVSPEVSFREMIYEAAVAAYKDAGIDPKDVDTFVSCSEDYLEGTAIFDEYVPDQLGAVLKPVHTITQDGLTGVAAAVLQLRTGRFRTAVVEAHSKASNLVYPAHIEALALDPVFVRPLGLSPLFVAGLDARAFLDLTDGLATPEDFAYVSAKNRRNALRNPRAAYPGAFSIEDLLASEPVAEPLRESDIAGRADGAVVVVLARESVARGLTDRPVFIEGIGWIEDTPNLDEWEWGQALYAEKAAAMAFAEAGIKDPMVDADFAEVDDTFSYKELVHLSALGVGDEETVIQLLRDGAFDFDGLFPVNPSGGSLGMGYGYDASGLRSFAEAVLQLRGEAGAHQLPDPEVAIVQSWRGIPTAMGAVAVLSNRA